MRTARVAHERQDRSYARPSCPTRCYAYGLFTGGLGAHYGAERLGCTVIPVSGGMTERQVRLIVDFEPDIRRITSIQR